MENNNKKYCIFSVFAEGSIDLTLEGSGLSYDEVLKMISEQYLDYIYQEEECPKTLSDNKLRTYIRDYEENVDFEYSLGPIVYEVLTTGRLKEVTIPKKDIFKCIKNLLSLT